MFKRVRLNNFRQHRDLEVFFEPGLNVLKGVNEAGKSTLCEGMFYCMFGAKLALRSGLDETVTWGEKVSTLKTEIEYAANGVTYVGRRSKAGAEVWLAGGTAPLVVGQEECRLFWENLLGVSGKVASSLMLANQQSLRGALEGGAAAPVVLIETLANFKLIDIIIRLVMSDLPNGQTKIWENNIEAAKQRLEEAQALQAVDIEPLETAEAAARTALWGAKASLQTAQKACDDHAPAAQAAQKAVNLRDEAATQLRNATLALESANAQNNALKAVPVPDVSRLAALRAQAADAKRMQSLRVAHAALVALGPLEPEWEGDLASLQAAITSTSAEVESLKDRKQELAVQRKGVEGRLIKETQCAFCDKQLSDVPEVLQRNSELAEQLATIDAEDLSLVHQLAVKGEELVALQTVERDYRKNVLPTYQRLADLIELSNDFVPAKWKWIGPDISSDLADPSAEISRIEAEQQAYARWQGQDQQLKAAVEQAQEQWTRASVLHTLQADDAKSREGDLSKALELAQAVAAATVRVDQAEKVLSAAVAELSLAQAVAAERATAAQRAQQDLEAHQRSLAEVQRGNDLLEKLRKARPQIADRLWTTVLQSVSIYFSTIRGVPSSVSRSDNGFLVDGQSISGLSGSTLDSLGMAIRIALVKTFLPNCRLMVLDEPAAACSNDREINMIGTVAGADFDQVLMITHSDLADSFAQKVIQL